ncbi:MAG TPA: dephospho-CoA kinase [Bacteroidales bacterium]|nr:dephospho-CoA kinase [Bacteroidales bacterium]
MIRLGLTGGIGTGKSVVARIFSEFDIPVFYGDHEAKKAYADPEVLTKVKQVFGYRVFDNDRVNFKKLADQVFTDQEKLGKLNSIIHPFLISQFEKWSDKQYRASYIIMEAAILYEASLQHFFDTIVAVSAPRELCIDRVMKRDGFSKEAVIQRMNNQWSDAEKVALSDYVIYNDGKQLLIPQVLAIHHEILNSLK